MDDDEEKLSMFSFNFDLMIVMVFFLFILGLKEVGIKEVDFFIVVIFDESWNMIVCMFVINLGVEKIVVCIDNYEYLLLKNKEFF